MSFQEARHIVSLENLKSDQSCCSVPKVLSNLPPINSLIKVNTAGLESANTTRCENMLLTTSALCIPGINPLATHSYMLPWVHTHTQRIHSELQSQSCVKTHTHTQHTHNTHTTHTYTHTYTHTHTHNTHMQHTHTHTHTGRECLPSHSLQYLKCAVCLRLHCEIVQWRTS